MATCISHQRHRIEPREPNVEDVRVVLSVSPPASSIIKIRSDEQVPRVSSAVDRTLGAASRYMVA